MSLTERIGRRIPEPLLRIVRPVYYGTIGRVYAIADRHGLIGPDEIYSENYYAKRKEDPWRSDAHIIADALSSEFKPNSVIDFGCAIGAYLEYFHQQSVEIRGVEGSSAALEHAVIPPNKIELHDLREPYHTSDKYDLAMCFEVAEHLPEEFADVFVDSLVQSADTIVMTAAKPGQAGTHHVNLQPREYWVTKFEQHGFDLDATAVESLRRRISVEEMEWIQDNLFVFTRR